MLYGFAIEGRFESLKRIENGHINQTWISHWNNGGQRAGFVHQRINQQVFEDVQQLMNNIMLVTGHIRSRIPSSGPDSEDCTLSLIPAKSGQICLKDEQGCYWRTYDFIDGTDNYPVCTGSQQAYEASRACARFQKYMLDLPPEKLKASIPYFQDVPRRMEDLRRARDQNIAGRLSQCHHEVDFAFSQVDTAGLLEAAVQNGKVPIRSIHGDLKISNVLFSRKSRRGICLLDLDTCMPGTIIYDFGDFVRSTGAPCAEDEQDFSKVYLDEQVFEAIVRGYLEVLGPALTPGELELLAFGPSLLALSLGVRFLADYLNGDTYFSVRRPEHNLQRCRTQFRILQSMQEKTRFMEQTVRKYFKPL